MRNRAEENIKWRKHWAWREFKVFMEKSVRGTEKGVEVDTLGLSWTTLCDSFISLVVGVTEGFQLGKQELLFKKINLKRLKGTERSEKTKANIQEDEFSFSVNWIICQYSPNQNTGNWNYLSPTTLHKGEFAVIGEVWGGERLHVLQCDIL